MIQTTQTKFCDKLKNIMDLKSITVAELARIAEIPASTIYNAINRDFKKMDIRHLGKISNALNVSMDYLVRDDITDPNYGIKPSDIIGNNDEMDVIDMTNAAVGWDDGDIQFVQAYMAMPKETRKALRDSLRILVTNMTSQGD